APLIGKGDVALLLDGVAEGDALGRHAAAEAELDLAAARHVEARAEPAQEIDDLASRVGLHRVEHLGERQVRPERLIGLADHVEVDDEARRLRLLLAEKALDLAVAVSLLVDLLLHFLQSFLPRRPARLHAHRRCPPRSEGGWSKVGSGQGRRSAVPWTRRSAQTARFTGSSTTAAAGDPDKPGRIVRPGRCGPESYSNHIDLPLGTGPQ